MDPELLEDLNLVPVLSFGVLGLAVVGALFVAVRAAARAAGREDIGGGPSLLAVRARLVAKRSANGEFPAPPQAIGPTDCYATFEFPSGERREFRLDESEYSTLNEGDAGVLLYDGPHYRGFRRPPARRKKEA
jgi:hypothetical protein